MKFYDIVHQKTREKGLTLEKLSLSLGHTSSYIGGSKSRGSLPKVDNAARIMDKLGYTLCLVPSDNVPEDAITIDF